MRNANVSEEQLLQVLAIYNTQTSILSLVGMWEAIDTLKFVDDDIIKLAVDMISSDIFCEEDLDLSPLQKEIFEKIWN